MIPLSKVGRIRCRTCATFINNDMMSDRWDVVLMGCHTYGVSDLCGAGCRTDGMSYLWGISKDILARLYIFLVSGIGWVVRLIECRIYGLSDKFIVGLTEYRPMYL